MNLATLTGLLVLGIQVAVLSAYLWDSVYVDAMVSTYPRFVQILFVVNVLALVLLVFGR